MSDIRCIGLSTGGGDAPGLNAVIRAAVKSAILRYKWKVIGIPDGFDGLIWPERVLGHIQRGGSPTPYDRVLATRFGVAAVDLIAAGGFGKTVCLKGEHIQAVDIADAIGQMKAVDPRGELIAAARAVGICFGD